MKEITKEVLGYNIPFQTYASLDEMVKAAGGEQKVLDKVNDFLLYHGPFGPARAAIVKAINELTKVPFKMVDTGEKDEAGKPVLERDSKDSDKIYATRAMTGSSVTKEQVQAAVLAAVKAKPLVVNIAEKIRQPGKPPVLPKKYAALALAFLTAALNPKTGKPRDLKKLNAKLKTEINKEFVKVNDTPGSPENVAALGWLLRELDLAQDPTGGI